MREVSVSESLFAVHGGEGSSYHQGRDGLDPSDFPPDPIPPLRPFLYLDSQSRKVPDELVNGRFVAFIPTDVDVRFASSVTRFDAVLFYAHPRKSDSRAWRELHDAACGNCFTSGTPVFYWETDAEEFFAGDW